MVKHVKYVKHYNKDENRLEFLLINYDYFDGNDIIAKLFKECFNMTIGEKIDGFFYNIISLTGASKQYKLVWHEDVGNYIYSEDQSIEAIETLDEMLNIIITKLNNKIENAKVNKDIGS